MMVVALVEALSPLPHHFFFLRGATNEGLKLSMSILQLVMQRKLIKFFTQTKQGLKGRRNNLGHNCFQFKFWAFVCCIHFHTYVLVKGIIPSLLLQIWVKQQVMLHSLALDGSQSKRRKTQNSKPWRRQPEITLLSFPRTDGNHR